MLKCTSPEVVFTHVKILVGKRLNMSKALRPLVRISAHSDYSDYVFTLLLSLSMKIPGRVP
jgi:hypothetical protein